MVTVSDLRRIVGGRDIRGDVKPLLNVVGALLVSQAQDAFKQQQFGGEAWPARYPNQSPFRINVAGALIDLNEGGSIKARRFNDRPAGVDEGDLRASITAAIISGSSVVVGSNLEPKASLINFGGESGPIPVTADAKQGLAKFLKGSRGSSDATTKDKSKQLSQRSKALAQESKDISQRLESGSITSDEAKALRAPIKEARQQLKQEREQVKARRRVIRSEFSSQVGFLFQIDQLTTTVAQRQYLPTEENIGDVEKDIAELVRLKIEGQL